jgi:phosphotransferase system IIB component
MILGDVYKEIICGVVAAVAILISLITCIILTKRNKGKVVVDEELIENLISFLGGKENIKSYNKDNGRVKFEIYDLSLVNLDNMKSISKNGVFVTGNNVKTLFKYDSEVVIKMLDKSLK